MNDDAHVKGTRDAQKSVEHLTYADPSDFFHENNEIGTEGDGQVRRKWDFSNFRCFRLFSELWCLPISKQRLNEKKNGGHVPERFLGAEI